MMTERITTLTSNSWGWVCERDVKDTAQVINTVMHTCIHLIQRPLTVEKGQQENLGAFCAGFFS